MTVPDINALARAVRDAWNQEFTHAPESAVDIRMARIAVDAVLAGLLDENRRWRVEQACDVLGTWDLARGPEPYMDRERVLADQIRALLEVIDEIAPKGDGR